jgi:hypothetical protein
VPPVDVDEKPNVRDSQPIQSEKAIDLDDVFIEYAAIFDLQSDVTDSIMLQRQLNSIEHNVSLTVSSIDVTSISEYAELKTLSLAFLTLYSTDAADFNTSRRRSITYKQYVIHLMRYKDERFARHSR